MIRERLFSLSRVKINSLANLARVVLGLPLSFFFTYFILKKISLAEYGSWALSISFFSYFSFFDCGMSTAVTRFVSYYHARQEKTAVNKVINTGLIFYLLVGFIVTASLLFFKTIILSLFFKSAGNNLTILNNIFILVVLMGYVDFVFSTFQGIINGFQRMDISSFVDFTKTFLFTLFGFILLSLQPSVTSLALAFVITTCIWAIISFFSCQAIFKQFVLSANHLDPVLFKKMFKFGFQSQFSSWSSYIHFNFDKLIIGHYLGVEKVAFLDIGLKLINQGRQFVSSFVSPLLPAAAEKTVLYKNKIIDFYQTSLRYIALASFCVFGGLFIASPILIKLWLGPGFTLAAQATQILSLGHFLNLLTGPAGSILLAQNKLKPVMVSSIIAGLVNIVFSSLGIYFFGFLGAVAGTSCSLILVNGFCLYLFPKYFRR